MELAEFPQRLGLIGFQLKWTFSLGKIDAYRNLYFTLLIF